MIEHSDLSLPIYLEVRKMILEGKLVPGQKLLQEKLAKDLGVSRTPLMKALQMLVFDFLVESVPRRGMFVKKITDKEMIDIYEVREGIEVVAVRLVAERNSSQQIETLKSIWKPFEKDSKINLEKYKKADERFHALLLEYSQNQVLQKTYSKSLIEARVIQMGLQRPPEETLIEHLSLVSALESRDSEEAEKLIKVHIRKSKASFEQNYRIQQERLSLEM